MKRHDNAKDMTHPYTHTQLKDTRTPECTRGKV